MNNWNVPKDLDTQIIEQSETTINGIPVPSLRKNWNSIKATSLIFHSQDVEQFNDDELLETIKKSGIQINSSVTFKRDDNGYCFVNYNFETS